MKYLKDTFNLCKLYVLNSIITLEDLFKLGYTKAEIDNMEKKRFLAKNELGYTIDSINHLSYFMEKLYQNDDSDLADKFAEKIKLVNPEYKTSNLNIFYLATLYGDYEIAYSYFKKMPTNFYTSVYQFLFSIITDITLEDSRKVINLELNDFLIADSEEDADIKYAIYFSKFIRAINLINEKYKSTNYISKYDAILKTLCIEAYQKKKDSEARYIEYLENEEILECKLAILNEYKKRKLNKNEKLLLELIDDYELISKGYVPQLQPTEELGMSGAIRANDFLLALCMKKTKNKSSISILLEKIGNILINNMNEETFEMKEFQKHIDEIINQVKNDNEIILLDEMDASKRLVFFKKAIDDNDIVVLTVGDAHSYRYIIMKNDFRHNMNDYNNYYSKANNYYKEKQYEEALENYKFAMFSLGKISFECIVKIGKCYQWLDNKELAYNYFMIAYYYVLRGTTREKTHRFLATVIYSMSYDIKDDYRFYQILANLNIFESISLDDLRRQYYLKNKDIEVLMVFIALKLKEIGQVEEAKLIESELSSREITSLKVKNYLELLTDENLVRSKKKTENFYD